MTKSIWAMMWKNQQSGCVPSEDSYLSGMAKADQSSLYAQWVAKDPNFLHTDSEDWAAAQADQSSLDAKPHC